MGYLQPDPLCTCEKTTFGFETVDELANELHIDPAYLSRVFQTLP